MPRYTAVLDACVLVPIALAGMQLLSGLGLAHGEDRCPGRADPELNGHEPPEGAS